MVCSKPSEPEVVAATLSPAALLTACWKDYPPQAAKLGRATYKALREQLPGANVLVYDYPRGLVIGFCPANDPSKGIVALAMKDGRVTLYFHEGKTFDDPDGVLQGRAHGRSVYLDEPATALESPLVQGFLKQALALSDPPMPKSGGQVEVRKVGAGRH